MRRSPLFVGWVAVGFAGTFASLYLFTPVGVGIAAVPAAFAFGLWRLSRPPRPEVYGAAAGPGAFALFVATQDDSTNTGLVIVGIALMAAALVAYAVAASHEV